MTSHDDHLGATEGRMTGQQLAHMENVITRFARDYRQKYVRGQAEHGGLLSEKPGMVTQARAEVLDLVSYLDVAQGQIASVSQGLRDGSISPVQAAELLDRILA